MATVNISATLAFSLSTSGLTTLNSTSPVQHFTPATGQRAYTLADTLTSLNDQINSNTDPTSTGADSPDILYNFQTSSDGALIFDTVSASLLTSTSVYDGIRTYIQGTWQ